MEQTAEQIVKAKWPDMHIYCSGQFDPEQKEIVILHDHSEPIAVLIPYALYMAVQELRDRLEQ